MTRRRALLQQLRETKQQSRRLRRAALALLIVDIVGGISLLVAEQGWEFVL